jgi:hypothetical protein
MVDKLTPAVEKKSKKNADQIAKLITKAVYQRRGHWVSITFKDKDVAALFRLFTGIPSISRTISFQIDDGFSADEIASLMRFVTEIK